MTKFLVTPFKYSDDVKTNDKKAHTKMVLQTYSDKVSHGDVKYSIRNTVSNTIITLYTVTDCDYIYHDEH